MQSPNTELLQITNEELRVVESVVADEVQAQAERKILVRSSSAFLRREGRILVLFRSDIAIRSPASSRAVMPPRGSQAALWVGC